MYYEAIINAIIQYNDDGRVHAQQIFSNFEAISIIIICVKYSTPKTDAKNILSYVRLTGVGDLDVDSLSR